MRTKRALGLLAFAALGAACGGDDTASLAVPDAPHTTQFTQVRYLVDSTLRSQGQRLADQLLGRRASSPPVDVAKPRRTKPRAVAPPVEVVNDPVVQEAAEDYRPYSLSESSFESTVSGWTGFKTCVRAARASGGAMKVAFSIDNTGDVKKTRVIDTSNALARSLAPCVERKARFLSFPEFEQDDEVTRVATFVF